MLIFGRKPQLFCWLGWDGLLLESLTDYSQSSPVCGTSRIILAGGILTKVDSSVLVTYMSAKWRAMGPSSVCRGRHIC